MVILKDEIYRNLPNRYNDPNSYLDINNQGHGKKIFLKGNVYRRNNNSPSQDRLMVLWKE